MKQLTAEQIQENWYKLRDFITESFEGERLEKLNEMYDYFEDRMVMAPASGKEHFHNAHVGGYVEHVMHVTDLAVKLRKVWEQEGASIDFTEEEVIFAALHHDLGKVGDLENDYYIPQESEWHRKNQGKIYEYSEGLGKMQVPDRSLFLLSTNGITYSETEYIGIKTHDGMYDDANKYYLAGYGGWTQKLKSSCSYIVHQADMMAARVEFEEWRDNYREGAPTKVSKPKQEKKVSTANNPINTNQAKAFDDLFKNLNA